MSLHIERPLSLCKVLMPKCYLIDLLLHTIDKWSIVYAISSRIYGFLFLKKSTSLQKTNE